MENLASADSPDTRTLKYNRGIFEDYGFAVSAVSSGRLSSIVSMATEGIQPSTIGKEKFDDVVTWLQQDPIGNISILESVVLTIGTIEPLNVNRIVDIGKLYSDEFSFFKDEMSRLSAEIAAGVGVIPSQETKLLAKAVAEMAQDNKSMEEWADQLTKDIAKADD